jgi:hypothetical protein
MEFGQISVEPFDFVFSSDPDHELAQILLALLPEIVNQLSRMREIGLVIKLQMKGFDILARSSNLFEDLDIFFSKLSNRERL